MSQSTAGRHRSAASYNPLAELGGIVAEVSTPAVKSTAVLAASGGMVAAFALPATAATSTTTRPASSTTAAKVVTTKAATTAAAPAKKYAVTAPARTAASAKVRYGTYSFGAVAKPVVKKATTTTTAAKATTAKTVTTKAASNTARTSVSTATSRTGHQSTASRTKLRTAAPTTTAAKPAASGVLGIAASLSGIYYVYGGSTPSGFDCSGFTSYVFRKTGVSLPRTAEQQRQAVTRVSSPQPGDLVFFGAPAYHVGIYAGNGKMYDSPRTGKTTGLHTIWSSNVSYGRP